MIRQYHYLGYCQPVGVHLKYLVYSGDRLLACFTFSSAPSAIDCRDTFLGWLPEARERNRHLLAYTQRIPSYQKTQQRWAVRHVVFANFTHYHQQLGQTITVYFYTINKYGKGTLFT